MFPEIEALAKNNPRWSNKNPMVQKYGFHDGPNAVEGKVTKCGTCELFISIRPGANKYFKCRLRGVTHGTGTDHRVSYDACAHYKPKPEEVK